MGGLLAALPDDGARFAETGLGAAWTADARLRGVLRDVRGTGAAAPALLPRPVVPPPP